MPPVEFKDLDGVLYGVQPSPILDTKGLDKLRDRLLRALRKNELIKERVKRLMSIDGVGQVLAHAVTIFLPGLAWLWAA